MQSKERTNEHLYCATHYFMRYTTVEFYFWIGEVMNTLPLWAQITICILGLINVTSIITFIFTIRQKDQELKDAKLQRLNDNLFQNTRPHIDSLYIPINKILAKLESRYDEYKAANGRCYGYEVKKNLDVSADTPESQASVELGLLLYSNRYNAILALTAAFQEMLDYQEKMIVEGTSAYLATEFEKRLNSFTRFLYGVNIVTHTYLLPLKKEPGEQAKVYVLGTPEFEKELYTEIDYIRVYIRELALGTTDTIRTLPGKSY